MQRSLAAIGSSTLVLCLTLAPGCDDSQETTTPTGGAAAGGTGGEGGTETPTADRGDPSDFPEDCFESCDEACAELASCGGDSSPRFPLEEEECLERCTFAEGGHFFPDMSGNFKCCTTRDDCFAVAHCGGWLDHPDAEAACDRYCECRTYSAVAELIGDRVAPPGYRFAPDLLGVDPGAAAIDWASIDGVELYRAGRLPIVRLDPTAGRRPLAELNRLGRVLPALVDSAGRASMVAGRVVLIVEQPATLGRALGVASRFGLDRQRLLATRLRAEPAAQLYLLEGTDGWQAVDAVAELSKLEGVRAELDLVRYYALRHTPNDPQFGDQWHLLNTGQNGSTPGVDGRVSEAWDVTMGDPQVIIAIHDDGVDLNHPEFAGRLETPLNYPADWEDQMTQGCFASHGTSVAGVAAAAADNADFGAGVCPGCRILPHMIECTDQGQLIMTDSAVAASFQQLVDAGAWVVNNSWGYESGDPVYDIPFGTMPALPAVVKASFDYAETEGRGGLGTVILFAGGNSNDVIDTWAGYETVLAVAAVDDLGLKAYYSAFAPENDLAAPSSGGLNYITTTARESSDTRFFGGTSSAAPFAAGVVGLVFSADPTLTAAEARSIVQSTATKIDPLFGQWDQDGHSVFYGSGLVNAYAAVQLAAGGCTSADTCVAPSDDCGASCGTGTQCDPCRTQADCDADHVCQALPSLGQRTCVAIKTAASCPTGTHEVGGYCLPSRATCGLCDSEEECNGRDDDCNGEIDDGDVCQGGSPCFIDVPGCDADEFCSGTRCLETCTADGDCGDDASCELLKDQYGTVPGARGCYNTGGGGDWTELCKRICEVRAASLPDEDLYAFVECMGWGEADCSVRQQCRELLP